MMASTTTRRITSAAGVLLLLACAPNVNPAEKPSEAFERYLSDLKKLCKQRPPRRNETTCDILKTKPVDPMSTPEGRFAHSIQLPDPLKPDSGYRRGMTQDEYFDHLCKNEAGAFIYERVNDVRGILMMRPRNFDSNAANHLYAPEAPFYRARDALPLAARKFVAPKRYAFLEVATPLPLALGEERRLHPSLLGSRNGTEENANVFRYFGYDGNSITSLRMRSTSLPSSRYGYTWRGISRPHDRELGIGGAELIVLELGTDRVMAFLRGYSKFTVAKGMGQSGFQWNVRCPRPRKEAYAQDRDFIVEVLNPMAKSIEEM